MNNNSFHSIVEKLLKKEVYPDEAEVMLNELKKQKQNIIYASGMTDKGTAQAQEPKTNESQSMDIAIIGVSGLFPDADDLDTLWNNLINGHDAVHLLPDEYMTPNQGFSVKKQPGKTTYKWGGILQDRHCFDPLFFNISPREAESMNPHQRLVLQESWKALEMAGYNPKSLSGSAMGIFIGAEPSGYFHESFTGYSDAIIASRLSYYLNLKGPAIVVNTGCSSSAASICLACESLMKKETSIALAGGVNANMNQAVLTTLSEIEMLSPTGKCRTFDESADGTVISEGVGIAVLKRLDDAVRDRDHILGVIKAAGMNQDGASNGITAPNGKAQEQLIIDLYRRHGINPEDISYVEAHGTGTKLGDPVEANAITRAFSAFTEKKHFCSVGSVKSHIGHTAAAAGIIGLIKILLSLRHRKIPGLINFRKMNPLIEFEDSAFYLQNNLSEWKASNEKPLTAALNSFGHSGTNVHLVIQEYGTPQRNRQTTVKTDDGQVRLVPLSARTWDSLNGNAQKLLAFLNKEQPDADPTLKSREKLLRMLRTVVAEVMNVEEKEVVPEEGIVDYGVGLIHLAQIREEVEKKLDLDTPCTGMNTCSSMKEMVDYLMRKHPRSVSAYFQTTSPTKTDISEPAPVGPRRTIDLTAMAYTLQIGREAMDKRVLFLVKDTRELIEQLEAFLRGSNAKVRFWKGQVEQGEEQVRLLASDKDMAETIDKWIVKRKLEKIAKFWVRGFPVKWQLLYLDELPRRINLPTYTFAKESYWYAGINTDVQSLHAASTHAGAIHPLLHQNTSNFARQRFTSVFTGNEFFLADHVVKGRLVLPGVAHLEIARAAIARATGDSTEWQTGFRLVNIGWVQPLSIGREPLRVDIELVPEATDRISYEIYSDSERADSAPVVYSRGSAVPSGRINPPVLDLRALKDQCLQNILDSSEIYAAFKAVGVALGQAFRGVQEVYSTVDQVLAKLSLPPSVSDTLDNFTLHPSMMDSALQASIVLTSCLINEERDPLATLLKPSLPFALQELEVFGKCTSSMWSLIRVGSSANEQVQKMNIDLCDDDGSVCARMKGFTFRVLEGEVGSAGISAEDGAVMFEPCWRENAIESPSIDSPSIEYPRYLTVLCEVGDVLQKKLQPLMSETLFLSVDAGPEADIDTRFQSYTAGIIEKIKSIFTEKTKRNELFVQIVHSATDEGRLFSGLSGLLKTASLENPSIAGQIIELNLDDSADTLVSILRLNRLRPDDTVIRYLDDKRLTASWQEIALAGQKTDSPWKSGGRYLITGGAGGLGLIFAEEIARQADNATVILTGRSPLSARKKVRLKELESLGAVIEYRQVDVTDKEAVEELIKTIVKNEKLHGIIHGAGICRDNFILKKSREEVVEVLAPKVSGLLNLDQASKEIDLDFFILFSSVSGAEGNTGQADYAAANAFMDAFARYRNILVSSHERHGKTLSINWPLWKDGGMKVDEKTAAIMMQSLGMGSMSTETGILALYQSMASGKEQIMVLEGDKKQLRTTFLEQTAKEFLPLPSARDDMPPLPANSGGNLQEMAVHYFKKLLAEDIRLPAERIEADAPLEKYGIDSILVMQMTSQLEKTFGSLSKTLFFEYRNIRELADYFLEAHGERLKEVLGTGEPAPKEKYSQEVIKNSQEKKVKTPSPIQRRFTHFDVKPETVKYPGPLDIAIIGVSGRYPGAETLDELWEILREGKDCIREVPKERWNHELYFDENKDAPGKVYGKWGGFIEGVDKFDPLFFNISPREAELIDPQERLFLQCVYQTLEDAGYAGDVLGEVRGTGSGTNVGLYAGVMYDEYQLYGAQEQILGRPVALWGIPGSIANRVSYFCNFHGPSMTVNTMCSSSLTAIYLACQSLGHGECEMAVAGGVNLLIHPNKYHLLSQYNFISSKGRCESFGQGGEGYVPGEGVGAVLLKPLSDAIVANDHIYGVIKAAATNHDGKTNGYTVPNPNAQTLLIDRALQNGNIDPRTISYVEAHGTGTSLGDPIEIAGLTKSFRKHTQDRQFCSIGSVKSNIGHCESAAGIAAVSKVLLQIKHRQLVPSLHSEILNPNIDFKKAPFVVQQELAEWKRPGVDGREFPRRAGISAFGAGGSNVHLIIEEYTPDKSKQPHINLSSHGPAVVILSAKNEDRLAAQVRRLLKALQQRQFSDSDLSAIAYTLQVGREAMEERLAILALSIDDLEEKLQNFLDGEDPAGAIFRGQVKRNQETLAAFTADEDMAVMIDAWFTKKKYAKLLDLWVKGLVFDWNRLYGADKPRRVSLPAYPFADERYWVPSLDMQTYAERQVRPTMPEIYPVSRKTVFLEKRWNQSPAEPKEDFDKIVAILTGEETKTLATKLSVLFPNSRILDQSELKAMIWKEGHDWSLYDGCIDLTGCGESDDEEVDWIAWLQQLIEKGRKGGLMLLCVTRELESFQNSTVNLSGAKRVGLYRMLQSEYGPLRSRHMDTDISRDYKALAEQIAAEFLLDSRETEICYRNGIRNEAFLEEKSIEGGDEETLLFPEDNVLWITGGTRGLGLLCAQHFVQQYGVRHLVLSGRVQLPPEEQWDTYDGEDSSITAKIHSLRDLTSQGVQVKVFSDALTDRRAMERNLRKVKKDLGPIGGIIHCAGRGSMENPAFIHKSMEAVKQVLEPKVAGLDTMIECFAKEPLRFFVLFSSVSAILPTLATGQSDYALANAYMDYVAELHRQAAPPIDTDQKNQSGTPDKRNISRIQNPECHVVSIQWPNWKETGAGEIKSKTYRRTGLLGLTDSEGLGLLDRILRQKEQHLILPAVVNPSSWQPQDLMRPVLSETRTDGQPKHPAIATPERLPDDIVTATRNWLVALVAKGLKIAPEKLEHSTPLQDYGVDSILLAQLLSEINKTLATDLDPSILYEYPTIEALAAWLPREHAAILSTILIPGNSAPEASQVRESWQPSLPLTFPWPRMAQSTGSGDIAVIGLSCRFPGAETLDDYWKLLTEGRSAIQPIPSERWGYTNDYHAGLVDNIYHFDPDFFLIPEDDARAMDPQALTVLEEGLKVWCHAGYSLSEIKGERVGVYLGARGRHKPNGLSLLQARNPIAVVGQNYLAANISHFFDLRGPSLVLDTACSSALVCMNIAAQALQSGEISAAMVGGVSFLTTDEAHQIFQQRNVLNPKHSFHVFDSRARGVVLGEGCGMVLLKTLEQALEDGDQIHAVMKSVAINNDGRTAGPATPNLQALEEVMQSALAKSGRKPGEISYIDVNGSGSEVTDLLELKAIQSVYSSSPGIACGLGSMKPNIGHPLCAQGMAGFIKVALMLKYRQLVPFLSGQHPMKHYDIASSPFYFCREHTDWTNAFHVAAINCFADGGTNAHVIMESFDLQVSRPPKRHPVPLPKLNRHDVRQTVPAGCSLPPEYHTDENIITEPGTDSRFPLNEPYSPVNLWKQEQAEF